MLKKVAQNWKVRFRHSCLLTARSKKKLMNSITTYFLYSLSSINDFDSEIYIDNIYKASFKSIYIFCSRSKAIHIQINKVKKKVTFNTYIK